MDLLYWDNLSKGIKQSYTKKSYFGRYLWRLEYEIQGANLITDKSIADIVAYSRTQREWYESQEARVLTSYYSPSSRGRTKEYWQKIDSRLLEHIRAVRNNCGEMAKFRVERNAMQVFTATEDDMKTMAERIGHYNIKSLVYPRPGTEQLLSDGVIYMGKTDYKFKITLKDGDYSPDIKTLVLNQLVSNPSVKIPNNLRHMLNKRHSWLWNCYFYSDDESVTTMLSLIAPGIVGKIHPIAQPQ